MPDGRVFIAGGAQLDYEIVNIDTYESQIIKNTIQEEKPLIQTGTDHPKLFADETTGNPVSVEGTRINYFDLKTLARISFRGWAKGWINHKDIIRLQPNLLFDGAKVLDLKTKTSKPFLSDYIEHKYGKNAGTHINDGYGRVTLLPDGSALVTGTLTKEDLLGIEHLYAYAQRLVPITN